MLAAKSAARQLDQVQQLWRITGPALAAGRRAGWIGTRQASRRHRGTLDQLDQVRQLGRIATRSAGGLDRSHGPARCGRSTWCRHSGSSGGPQAPGDRAAVLVGIEAGQVQQLGRIATRSAGGLDRGRQLDQVQALGRIAGPALAWLPAARRHRGTLDQDHQRQD